jgi:glycosyltransferase involved in cell wall biosynthesis
MVGGPARSQNPARGDPDDFFLRIKEDAKKIPNLDFFGFVHPSDVNRFFSEDAVFVNTSSYEGFPNTFLQAWENGMPVISLNADPDGIIKTHNLGLHSKTFSQLVLDVDYLMKNENKRAEYGINGRKYLEREHDMRKIISKYFEIFQ